MPRTYSIFLRHRRPFVTQITHAGKTDTSIVGVIIYSLSRYQEYVNDT